MDWSDTGGGAAGGEHCRGHQRCDKYGCDPDRFSRGVKKYGWGEAVQYASLVHIDEMRALLELHYDDVRLEKWRGRGCKGRRPPKPKSDMKILDYIGKYYQRQKNMLAHRAACLCEERAPDEG